MDVLEKTERVKEYALTNCGFDDIGIAKAEKLEEEGARLKLWLREGFHGLLEYLERNIEKRIDPQCILPGARSVIVVAQNYYTPYSHCLYPNHGKISRYAWGKDYHKVMAKKLRKLSRFIKEMEPSAATKFYVDTGPVLEKQWAVRAGIGWQGKHTNVISRKFGSWIFLGVLCTTLELRPDSPIKDYCGRCTACIDACPTQAITQPYVLDATRCISYWTIEVKADKEIPDNIAERLEGWIFGCDICQEVCPWNKFQKPSSEQLFAPVKETTLHIDAIEQMDETEYAERFRGMPIKRAKLQGLKRNARALRLWWHKREKAQ